MKVLAGPCINYFLRALFEAHVEVISFKQNKQISSAYVGYQIVVMKELTMLIAELT